MFISPNYTAEDWKQLKFSSKEDWEKAVGIFRDRIWGRFFNPISAMENCPFCGFAVLCLDCLLIETYQQFINGVLETPQGKTGTYFEHFLTQTSFKEWFDNDKAGKFYKQFRNGLLHQAEVKESSLVKIGEDIPLVKFTEDKKGLVINRKKFHRHLIKEFESYMEKLLNPSEKLVRKNFRKKMDFICRIPDRE
jgi:hypothetical protein